MRGRGQRRRCAAASRSRERQGVALSQTLFPTKTVHEGWRADDSSRGANRADAHELKTSSTGIEVASPGAPGAVEATTKEKWPLGQSDRLASSKTVDQINIYGTFPMRVIFHRLLHPSAYGQKDSGLVRG